MRVRFCVMVLCCSVCVISFVVHLCFFGCFRVFLVVRLICFFFFFSSRRRHTRCLSDSSSDVCSSDLPVRPKVTILSTPRGSETVLLAEDDDGLRLLIHETLRERGYRVLEARNGAERSEERRVGKECRCRWSR